MPALTEIRRTDLSGPGLAAVAALLGRVFPDAPHLDATYLAWSHRAHPLGPAPGADAWLDGRLVGHAAARPLEARLHGDAPERGLLVHHAATDAAYRRRGVLVACVEAVLGRGADELGAGFAVAVVNDRSVRVFAERLGFARLGALEVRAGVGPLAPRAAEAAALDFEPARDPAWLAWRLACPARAYRGRARGPSASIWALHGRLGVPVQLGDVAACAATASLAPLRTRLPLRVWVGLDAARHWGGRAYVDLPLALRPAPLHLVFRDLRGGRPTPARGRIRFEGLDFDAW